jgi:NADH:ubiquinone oxidoreductase subunit 5 (subunit L)/multisubunit Na+/H+ antiporter MnhA subunit
VSLEWVMAIISASIVVLSLLIAYFRYVRRPVKEPERRGVHEFLFEGLYLDRLYQMIFVRPYLKMTDFVKGRVEERVVDRVIDISAQGSFRHFWNAARYLWLAVDESSVDKSYVKGAGAFIPFSRALGCWTTGRLSTYLTMLLLGLTVFLAVLAYCWFD